MYTEGRTIDAESNLDLTQFDGTGEYEVMVAIDGNITTTVHAFESGGNSRSTTNIGIDNQGTVTVE